MEWPVSDNQKSLIYLHLLAPEMPIEFKLNIDTNEHSNIFQWTAINVGSSTLGFKQLRTLFKDTRFNIIKIEF